MASLPLDRVYHLKMILILLPWKGYNKIKNQIQNLSKINTRLHLPSSSIFNSLHLPYSIILFRQSFYTSLILTHIFKMILINANSLQNNDEKIQTNPNSTLQSPKVAGTYLFPYKPKPYTPVPEGRANIFFPIQNVAGFRSCQTFNKLLLYFSFCMLLS